MKIISGKNYYFGFKLNESELRRIINLIKEQLMKVNPNEPIIEKYEIIYTNGGIAEFKNLDIIFEEENFGSLQITNLKCFFALKEQSEEQQVTIQFNDLDESPIDLAESTISFKIIGKVRDWVFTTSSFLEERIQKVSYKHKAVEKIIGLETAGFVGLYGLILLMLFSNINIEPKVENYEIPKPKQEINLISELESLVDSNSFKTPIEAVIGLKLLEEKKKIEVNQKIQEWKETRSDWHQKRVDAYNNKSWNKIPWYLKTFIVLILPCMIYHRFRKFCNENYASYNFLWGDYVELYTEREVKLKFVLNVVIIGTLISFLGGILANLL